MPHNHDHHNERTPTSCTKEAEEGHVHDDNCGHDHSDDKIESGFEQTLYPYIDMAKVSCINEHTLHASRNVFKPFDQRKNDKYCESAVDEELIFYIPFTVSVKLKSISIIGGDPDSCPSSMKLFRNRDDIDLDNCEDVKPDQDFEVAYDKNGTFDYMLRASKFQNVNTLVIYFPANHGAENTRVNYIGIKGESTTYKRAVVEAVYESAPQLSDHEVRGDQFVPRNLL